MNKDGYTSEPQRGPFQLLTLPEAGKVLFRRWRMLVVFIGLAVSIGLIQHKFFPAYEATAEIQVKESEAGGLGMPMGLLDGRMGGFQDGARTAKYLRHLSSPQYIQYVSIQILEDPISVPEFITEYFFESEYKFQLLSTDAKIAKITTKLPELLLIRESGPGLLRFRVRAEKKSVANYLVNIVTDSAIAYVNGREAAQIQEAESFIHKKISETKADIKKTDEEISEIQRKNTMISTMNSRDSMSSYAYQLRSQLVAVNTDIRKLEKLIEGYEQRMNGRKSMTRSTVHELNDRILRMKDQIQAQMVLKQTIESQLKEIAGSNAVQAEARAQQLSMMQQGRVSMLAQYEKQLSELEMKKIFSQGGLDSFSKSDRIEIYRENPIKKIVVATVLAIASWLAMIYLLELVRPRIHSKSLLIDAGYEFLGPVIKTPENRFGLMNYQANNISTNAIFNIRSRLAFLHSSEKTKSNRIAVLGFGPGDDSAYVARNLAGSMAHSGRKVILIDADLNRSHLSKNFGVGRSAGLFDVLNGTKKFGEIVHTNLYPKLDFLSIGTLDSQSAERLMETAFSQLISDLASVYTYVVISGPSVENTYLGPILASLCDTTVMVATLHQTSAGSAYEWYEQVHSATSKNPLAVLLEGNDKIEVPHSTHRGAFDDTVAAVRQQENTNQLPRAG